MSKPVVIYISAKTCPACVNFASQWPSVKDAIEKLGAETVEVSLPNTMSELDTTKYPSNLKRYIAWYPSLAIVNGYNWNQAMKQPGANYSLDGKVFNGNFDIKGNLGRAVQFPLTVDGVTKWLEGSGMLPAKIVIPMSNEDSKWLSTPPAIGATLATPGSAFTASKATSFFVPNAGIKDVCGEQLKLVPRPYHKPW